MPQHKTCESKVIPSSLRIIYSYSPILSTVSYLCSQWKIWGAFPEWKIWCVFHSRHRSAVYDIVGYIDYLNTFWYDYIVAVFRNKLAIKRAWVFLWIILWINLCEFKIWRTLISDYIAQIHKGTVMIFFTLYTQGQFYNFCSCFEAAV